MWMNTYRGRFRHCSSSCQPLWATLGLNEPENKTLCLVVGGLCVWDEYCTADRADSDVIPWQRYCTEISILHWWWSYLEQLGRGKGIPEILTEKRFIFGKNPHTHHAGTRVAEHGMWYGCPAHERVWLICWQHGDTFLGYMQCHKCHMWSIEGCTVWVRGHCSQYTARGKEGGRGGPWENAWSAHGHIWMAFSSPTVLSR